ncbi:MAG: thiol:disulfide interchange protein TlpA [Alphaproteobacteria bacterium]
MDASNKRKHAGLPAKYVIAACLAVIAGFATVYLSLALSDNGRTSASVKDEAAKGAGSGPLAGLNKGPMAAFVARKAPLDLPDVAFEGPDGAPMSLADLKGKVVLLNIWATWCVPCREEMPQLNALQAGLGGGDFEVVAINIDKGGVDKAKAFLEETGATDLAFYADPSAKLFAKLKAVGMPTTLLLNAQGQEIGRLVGPADWASPEAKKLIETAIKNAG